MASQSSSAPVFIDDSATVDCAAQIATTLAAIQTELPEERVGSMRLDMNEVLGLKRA